MNSLTRAVQRVVDGLAAGANWSYLQFSQAGYGIFRRLGFETVEHWDCWVKQN